MSPRKKKIVSEAIRILKETGKELTGYQLCCRLQSCIPSNMDVNSRMLAPLLTWQHGINVEKKNGKIAYKYISSCGLVLSIS